MEALSIKDSDPTMFGSRMSTWFSKKQPVVTVSASEATEVTTMTKEGDYDAKLSSSQYQELDSSSTLSTGQSHHEGPLSPPKLQMQNVPFQPGETYRRRGEDRVEPSLPCGSADYPSELEYNQSSKMGQVKWDNTKRKVRQVKRDEEDWASYFMTAPYSCNPNALVSCQISQMVGVAQARAVLPPDQAQGIPMFVNAKQYYAILRRRQTRAKLETQNKAARTRKPYLHESRHHHALRRARGSGGRFLNTKNLQQPTQKPETQHSESTSTTSSSDASCVFNNDYVFQRPDSRASSSSLTTGAYSRMMAPNDLLILSVERRAQIRT